MGSLMRAADVALGPDETAVMTFLADHWTPADMDAWDALGADAYMAWVDRGYAGR